MCEARRPLQQKSSVFSSSPLRLIEIFLANFLTPLPPLAQHSFPLLHPLSQSPFLPSLLRLVIRLKSCQPQLSPLVKREPQKSAAKTSSSLPSCSAPASLRSAVSAAHTANNCCCASNELATSSRSRFGDGDASSLVEAKTAIMSDAECGEVDATGGIRNFRTPASCPALVLGKLYTSFAGIIWITAFHHGRGRALCGSH